MADPQQQQQQQQQEQQQLQLQQQLQQQQQELLKCVTPDETAGEFFRRHGREALATGLPCIDAFVRLRPGHLVELVGPAGAAKTELLMQMIANVLVATGSGSVAAEEQEHVVMVDCDGKFDYVRLMQILGSRPQLARGEHARVVALLARFHLVRCWTSLELLLALHNLPQQLRALKGRCRLLLLDNVAASVWLDRASVFSITKSQLPLTTAQQQQQQQQQQAWQQQQQQPQQQHYQQQQVFSLHHGPASTAAPAPEQAGPGLDTLHVQGAVAALLVGLSQQLRVPVVATKQAGVSHMQRDGSTRLVQRELLTAPWHTAVSHRLLMMPAAAAPGAAQGSGARVLLQWQSGDFVGPLQCVVVGSDALHPSNP